MRHRPILLLTSLLLLSVGCGDDDPTAPTDEELFVGTFEATSMIFTPVGGGNPVDVIPFGASLTVTTDSDGEFTWTIQAPGDTPETETGTLIVDASTNTVTVDFEAPVSTDIVAEYAFSDDDDTLTLQAEDVEFDLNQDGVDERASVQVVMERQ